MEDIKLAVTKFERFIRYTPDHIYFGILKRRFWDQKQTKEEWFATLENLKKEPA